MPHRIGEALGLSEPGSLEDFFLERNLLFSERAGRLHEGRVRHVPNPAHRVEVHSLDEGLLVAAGLPPNARPPELLHCSPGVEVFKP